MSQDTVLIWLSLLAIVAGAFVFVEFR